MQKSASDRTKMAKNSKKPPQLIQRKSVGSVPNGSVESEKSQKSSSFKKGKKGKTATTASENIKVIVAPQSTTNREAQGNQAILPISLNNKTSNNAVFDFDIRKDEPKWLKSQDLNS